MMYDLFFSERMFQINECLKIKLDRINNKLENISFEEHIELKGVIHEHVMWIEDCWTSLHCLYPFFKPHTKQIKLTYGFFYYINLFLTLFILEICILVLIY